eukprot:COSAG02_NODE_3921_length_6045_cov_2.284729_2_plen_127_part_00
MHNRHRWQQHSTSDHCAVFGLKNDRLGRRSAKETFSSWRETHLTRWTQTATVSTQTNCPPSDIFEYVERRTCRIEAGTDRLNAVTVTGLLDESEVAELAALMQGGRALSEKELLSAMVRHHLRHTL